MAHCSIQDVKRDALAEAAVVFKRMLRVLYLKVQQQLYRMVISIRLKPITQPLRWLRGN